jgi:hypothetical protein
MKPRIATWFDNDVALLSFEVCDGNSLFSNEAYAELDWGTKAATALARFGHQIHGGLFNLETGDGGPEYAGGAFRARFHFYKPAMLLISTVQQAEYIRFKDGQVAAEARMFLRTEPALLDRFISALPVLDKANGREAVLECVALDK